MILTTARISCGITHLSQVICWGSPVISGASPLGNPAADTDSLAPVLGGEQGGTYLEDIKKISAGWYSGCALTNSDEVYC